MVVTLGQQYNVGEEPTAILYTTYINRHAGTPEKQHKQKQWSTPSNMVVVIIYCYIGCSLNTKPLHGILTGSPMEITLGQQYNVGEKPTVILYTYINRHAEPPCNHSET